MKLNLSLIRLLASLLILALSTSAIAKSPVWKVSNAKGYLYLGGTIHVLSQADYPLPPAFEKAFADSQKVIFETDIEAMASPEVQALLLAEMVFQDERTLQGELREDTYAELVAFLNARAIPISNFVKFRPVGISLALPFIELQRLGLMNAPGVDAYYTLKAKNEGKQSGFLETIKEQIGFIRNMGNEDSDQMIKSTIHDIDNLSNDWKELLDSWRTGDITLLAEIGLLPMQREFPDMYKSLLTQRNQLWLEKIKPMFNSSEVEFLLLGSLHMVGKDGLIKQLQAAGYKVDQMD